MFVELNPLDTLFTRDSRAFGVNQAHAVDSLFPPPPSVLFGAFRGALLTSGGYRMCQWGGTMSDGTDRPDWFGNGSDAGKLRQRGPVVLRNGVPLFPMPLDAALTDGPRALKPLPLVETPNHLCNIPTPYCFRESHRLRRPKTGGGGLIDAALLEAYLGAERADAAISIRDSGKNRNVFPTAADSDDDPYAVWANERRTNVGIDPKTYAGVDGKLFSLTHVRMNAMAGASLLSEWDGPPEALALLAPGENGRADRVINVGGEKRAAVAREKKGFRWPEIAISPAGPGPFRFRLYMATPAFFREGWRPGMAAGGVCQLQSDAGDVVPARLMAAAVGKYLSIGGYDIEKHQERPIRRFVPAGTVYYFETNVAITDVFKALNGKTVGDDPFVRAQGFGLAFVGACPRF